MFKYLKLVLESFLFSLQSVIVNKLRTMLSLLGITIGIFAIISVFTIVDSLEYNIRESVSALGSDVVYIEKWPWTEADGSDYKWWQYVNRPVAGYSEYLMLRAKSTKAGNLTFVVSVRQPVIYEKNQSDNTTIMGVSEDFEQIRAFELTAGRYLTNFEIASGRNYAIIGSTVASRLFPFTGPLGKTITVRKQKLKVIGVLEKEGRGAFGDTMDETIILSVNYIRNLVDIKSESLNPSIWVKAAAGVSNDELIDELRMIMRSVRRLKPNAADNFALNQTSLINNQLDNFFKTLNIAGWFIGLFSLLVGGFGIANIMFVSVKERTNIIGIQKALGAKRYFILYQFLFEAVMLAIAGGIIGLLLVATGTLLISGSDFAVSLRISNIVMGLGISTSIGLISGLAPAWSASRLDPVEAINNTF